VLELALLEPRPSRPVAVRVSADGLPREANP